MSHFICGNRKNDPIKVPMYSFTADTFYQRDNCNFNIKITDADKDEGIHVTMRHINV